MGLIRDKGIVTFEYDNRMIYVIRLLNEDLLGPTGGYYIIGSYGGPDDPNNNLASSNDGEYLATPQGVVKGAKYSIGYRRIDQYTMEVSVEVGPLDQPYESLSIPLDCDKTKFTHYNSPAPTHLVGAGNQWTQRAGGSGAFADIPLLADIGIGKVGVARVTNAIPWGEIIGPYATIRRDVIQPAPHKEWNWCNHPNTNNNEMGISGDMSMNPPLAAGLKYRMVERITVIPPGGPPSTPLRVSMGGFSVTVPPSGIVNLPPLRLGV